MKKACSVIIIIIAALVSCNPVVKKDIDQKTAYCRDAHVQYGYVQKIMLKKVYPTYAIWAVD